MATATESNGRRIDVLARPKQLPPTFREDRRSVYWLDRPPVTNNGGTTAFVLTPRQEELANSKYVSKHYQGDRPSPIWPVSKSAQKGSASERVQVLSEHKKLHREFQTERPVHTTVSSGAKSAEASDRVTHLALPKVYVPLKIRPSREWDVDEWQQEITNAAKNAHASARLEALSEAKVTHTLFQPEKTIQWPVSEPAMKALATIRLQQLARPKSRGKYDNYDPYKVTPAARNARPTPRIGELALPIPRKVRTKKVLAGGGP
ncbi:sperm microtubule associated protein 2-like isoform X2 [Ptychodera flava]|uniref:sperm microtubule associated protein 2-like isoform X2 n=1 Tax=Ptychodera flava TaxID=63121 RepID=UPI00396AA0F6